MLSEDVVKILGLIASLIAILGVIFSSLKKAFSRNKLKGGGRIDSGNIEILFLLSYLFMRIDQIKQTGLWGRTITKYINLNFPDNKEINNKLNQYKTNGSITHTSHALKALYELWHRVGHYPDLSVTTIDDYLRRIRRKSGLFHPEREEIVNIEEFNNMAHELRHNSTSLTTIYYLKQFSRDAEKRAMYNCWIDDSLSFIRKLPHESLWKCDPEYEHSLAYMLESFALIKTDSDVLQPYKNDLEEYIIDGIDALVNRLDSNYWLLRKHNATKCFYTLLILDILLKIEEFAEDSTKIDKAYHIVNSLANIRNKDNGLSLGALNDRSKYSFSDIGVTARFAAVLHRLSTIMKTHPADSLQSKKENLDKWEKESKEFIQENYLNLSTGNYNAFTHSFESVLFTIDLFEPFDKTKLRNDLIRADQIVNCLFSKPQLTFKEIDLTGIPHAGFIKQIVIRDMIHNPSKMAKVLGLTSYWA